MWRVIGSNRKSNVCWKFSLKSLLKQRRKIWFFVILNISTKYFLAKGKINQVIVFCCQSEKNSEIKEMFSFPVMIDLCKRKTWKSAKSDFAWWIFKNIKRIDEYLVSRYLCQCIQNCLYTCFCSISWRQDGSFRLQKSNNWSFFW